MRTEATLLFFFFSFYFNGIRREILECRHWCETPQQHCIGGKGALQRRSNVAPVGDPLIVRPLLHRVWLQPCALWPAVRFPSQYTSLHPHLEQHSLVPGCCWRRGRRLCSCTLWGFMYLLAMLMCRQEGAQCNCVGSVLEVDQLRPCSGAGSRAGLGAPGMPHEPQTVCFQGCLCLLCSFTSFQVSNWIS